MATTNSILGRDVRARLTYEELLAENLALQQQLQAAQRRIADLERRYTALARSIAVSGAEANAPGSESPGG